MAGYLACDGFTSTFQSKLFKGYQMTIYNQILYTTLFSAGLSLVGAFHTASYCPSSRLYAQSTDPTCLDAGLVSSGQLSAALAFVHRHPESVALILALSAASTAGGHLSTVVVLLAAWLVPVLKPVLDAFLQGSYALCTPFARLGLCYLQL